MGQGFDDLGKLLGLYGAAKATLEHGSKAFREAQKLTETRGREAYEETHWGQEADETIIVGTFPDASGGTTVLGRLIAIEYETTKGSDRAPVVYRHEFDTEPGSTRKARSEKCPLLCFTFAEHPSGLVIARANSRYTVTPHGIEH